MSRPWCVSQPDVSAQRRRLPNRDRGADRIGADAWLAKPFRLLEVIEAVDRLVHDQAA
jgi:CheY-like chemotaxis protein